MIGRRRGPSDQSAFADAMAMLARRDYSAAQLRTKLAQRGQSADDIEAALARLREDGYLDDARVADSIIRRRSGTGWGPQRVQSELGAQGVAGDLGRSRMVEADVDWESVATDALRQRLRGAAPPDDRDARNKLLGWMMRRGFSLSVARAALARLEAEARDAGAPDG